VQITSSQFVTVCANLPALWSDKQYRVQASCTEIHKAKFEVQPVMSHIRSWLCSTVCLWSYHGRIQPVRLGRVIPVILGSQVSLLGQPIFWPNNFKFWLYNLQILTYFDLSISCVCNWNVEYKTYIRNQTDRLKFSVEIKQISKVRKTQTKLEVTNHRQKSIQTHISILISILCQ